MWLFNSTLTYLVIGYLYNGEEPKNDFTVDTIYGTVRGTKSAVSRNGRSYYEFLGIPYAKPPIGKLRFEPPVPPHSWDGIFNGTSPGNRCLQIRIFTNSRLGDEDCLNLNVYTHQIQTSRDQKTLDKLHPVIYYIHGGFFMAGSADVFGAKYYMDEDVVLITANYRVASLGFLNTGDGEVHGNMGLKDQVMVLKWIQENIQYFGGDPNRVTIVGESAGAVAAHYHMLSPLSKGLFHRAVSQSGNALAPWAFNLTPKKQSQHFAHKLNCTRNSTKEMVQCLKSLDAYKLIEAHRDAVYHLEDRLTLFRPSVEVMTNEWTFLNDTPINIIKNGKTAQIPWIAGVNSHEGLVFAAAIIKNETRRSELSKNWNDWIPIVLGFENEILKENIAKQIRIFYFGNLNTEFTEDCWENMTNLMSDYNFFNSLHNVGSLYQNGVVNSSSSLLYLYYFTYHTQFSLGKIAFSMSGSLPLMADLVITRGYSWFSTNVLGMIEKHYGAAHADEMFLMFNTPFQVEHKNGTKDYEMSINLIKLWTSFARDGKPKDEEFEWLPVQQINNKNGTNNNSNQTIKYLRLDKKFDLIDEPFYDRMKFWKSLNLS